MNLITLTTDFGTQDWFVGTMKGVILGLCPQAKVVDITHQISPGDIRGGAFALAASCRFFPKGTVHLAVVDPGVGSARPAIAVRTSDYHFVGPDNGVLSFALANEKVVAIRRLENPACFLQPISRTFHGRDVFAPVTARLSRGFTFTKLGPAQKSFVRLSWPEPRRHGKSIEGEIIYIDRFGNLITNIREVDLRAADFARWQLRGGCHRGIPGGTHYQSVARGEPVAVIGSSGLMEIAINGGSAARKLGLRIGSAIRLMSRR